MMQAVELLDSNTTHNFSSRQALIQACDAVVCKIINSIPVQPGRKSYSVTLPRGYRLITLKYEYGEQPVMSRYLAPPDPTVNVAINSNRHRMPFKDHDGDFVEDADRPVLLAFAKHCATGLIEEIVTYCNADRAEDDAAVRDLADD